MRSVTTPVASDALRTGEAEGVVDVTGAVTRGDWRGCGRVGDGAACGLRESPSAIGTVRRRNVHALTRSDRIRGTKGVSQFGANST